MCFLPLPCESQGANSSFGGGRGGEGEAAGVGDERLYLLYSVHDPRNVLKSFLP